LTTLFTINNSWHKQAWVFEQLGFASQGDAIVLLEDGVLSLQSAVALASFIAKCQASDISVYALENDLIQRGVDNQYAQVKLIDYTGLVKLVLEYDKQVAW